MNRLADRLLPLTALILTTLGACSDDQSSLPDAIGTGPTATSPVTSPATSPATSLAESPVSDTSGSSEASHANTTSADASTPEAWSFTDDVGVTVELAAMPTRIVMFEDVAASLMDFGVDPVGIHYLQGEGNNKVMDGIDISGIANVGETCGVPNLEAVAATDPDLFVYMHWGGEPDLVFCLDEVLKIRAIAPIIQIEAVGAADEILQRYAELAQALGADLESADLTAKRERYEAAAERLRAAVAARPEITVLPASISPEWAGVAEPLGFADLVTLQEDFGIEFEGPFSAPFTETYWAEYSGETLHEVRGDVILMDSKNDTPLELKTEAYPLWAALPEVVAGQIVPWLVPGSFSYTRDAAFMEALAEAIEQAEDLVP